jgi:hypothetical protein
LSKKDNEVDAADAAEVVLAPKRKKQKIGARVVATPSSESPSTPKITKHKKTSTKKRAPKAKANTEEIRLTRSAGKKKLGK